MKKTFFYLFSCLTLLSLSFYIYNRPTVSKEDVGLQATWESPAAKIREKFTILMHDFMANDPLADEKNYKKAWQELKNICSDKSKSTQEQRAMCRIISNKNRLKRYAILVALGVPLAVYLGIVIAISLPSFQKVSLETGVITHDVAIDDQVREKLKYLDQEKSSFSPFEILNLKPDASKDDARKAYRKLALKYHPDKHPQQSALYTEVFKAISNAYKLIDEEGYKEEIGIVKRKWEWPWS